MRKIYFVDGHIARSNIVGIPAYADHDDGENTFFYMHDANKGAWAQRSFDHQIVSLTYTSIGAPAHQGSEQYTWHLLSKRGTLIQRSPGDTNAIEIDGADTGAGHGYMARIRIIGNHIYTCGFGRQVYRLDDQIWHCISKEIMISDKNETRFAFRDIAGTDEENIYAVGWLGELFHYNGSTWRRIDTPTNVDLTSIRVEKNGRIHISAKNGILLSGTENTLKPYKSNDVSEPFWDIEIFNDQLYLAHLKGLCTLSGDQLISVDTGLQPSIGSYRLDANEDFLWSFGHDDLAYFDKKKWTRVICPDQ